jgi:hypothetical protein
MKKGKSAQGKRAKIKGREFERMVIQAICEVTGLEYGKDIRRRYSGEEGDDSIILSRKAMKIFPFSIESKNRKAWSVYKWWEQAKGNTPEDCMTALVMHKHGSNENLVMIDFDVFLKFVEMVVEELDDK